MNIQKIRQFEKATKAKNKSGRLNYPRLLTGESYTTLHDLGLRGLEIKSAGCVIVYLPKRQKFLIVAMNDDEELSFGYDLKFDSLVETVATARVMSSTSVRFSRRFE